MARYTGPACRLCRREGMKLFLKGDRCFKEKCSLERRSYPPGQHGQRQQKLVGYGLRLREKQKAKRMYGLVEKQFHRTYLRASRMKGVKGENLLRLLELRLDNVVYRLGFASSRKMARQLVSHGHFLINGRKTDVPSVTLRVGDVVVLKEKSRNNPLVLECLETAEARGIPAWLEMDRDNFTGKVVALPSREDIAVPIQEQLIVELYSR